MGGRRTYLTSGETLHRPPYQVRHPMFSRQMHIISITKTFTSLVHHKKTSNAAHAAMTSCGRRRMFSSSSILNDTCIRRKRDRQARGRKLQSQTQGCGRYTTMPTGVAFMTASQRPTSIKCPSSSMPPSIRETLMVSPIPFFRKNK